MNEQHLRELLKRAAEELAYAQGIYAALQEEALGQRQYEWAAEYHEHDYGTGELLADILAVVREE